MRVREQKGEGRVGFIITLAICCALAFVGFKIIPVRIAAYEFRDLIRQETRMGAVRDSDAIVAKRILDAAEDMEIPLNKKNLKVRRTRSEMVVEASYELPIDLKVTTYVYRFNAKEKAPLF